MKERRNRTSHEGIVHESEYVRSREQVIAMMMKMIKSIAETHGFEIHGRIEFKDKRTNRIFK